MNYFALTDIGRKRTVNQDSVYASNLPVGTLPNLFIVADGMGGEAAGDYASATTISVVTKAIESCKSKQPVRVIEQAIFAANEKIYTESCEDADKRGMGTTLVIATVIDSHLYVSNVGDSRLYIADENGLTQITRDHSVVAELVRVGKISPQEAKNHRDKNKITRAIGAQDRVVPDFFDVELNEGQKVLMCSDGLTNMLGEEEMFDILKNAETEVIAVQTLVEAANAAGGADNITCIVFGE